MPLPTAEPSGDAFAYAVQDVSAHLKCPICLYVKRRAPWSS